ncbi:MAG: NADH-quinone oxidoreductase subunit NuoH [Deltaproteobacteria bacterium]|nr:NADH-quinone oxidoreductase subunit NuoH [Deltaproteobacteria bacterium]
MTVTLDQGFVQAYQWILGVARDLGLPVWLVTLLSLAIPVVVVIAIYAGFFAFLTWLERKVISRIQNRYGPNRVGPFGLFQPVADGIKALTKEDVIPAGADRLLHWLAPCVVVVPAITVYALLPLGRNMTAVDTDVSVLLFFAISSVSTLALFIAGWASHNKYSMLGAMRAIAQMISYELPLVLGALPAIMVVGSMNLGAIVKAQGPQATGELFGGIAHWNLWTPWGFVGFVAFFIAGMAELNRSPFDIAEGESEIIAGFHTEYSGFKFALFFMAEYLSTIAFSALASSLYLGGWNGPAFLPSWLVLFLKIFGLIFVMMWIRSTLPRLRVDQLMAFSWKFLLPLAIVNIFATGLWHVLPRATLADKAVAWGAAALVLIPTYLLLAKLNGGRATEQRRYRYADL